MIFIQSAAWVMPDGPTDGRTDGRRTQACKGARERERASEQVLRESRATNGSWALRGSLLAEGKGPFNRVTIQRQMSRVERATLICAFKSQLFLHTFGVKKIWRDNIPSSREQQLFSSEFIHAALAVSYHLRRDIAGILLHWNVREKCPHSYIAI